MQVSTNQPIKFRSTGQSALTLEILSVVMYWTWQYGRFLRLYTAGDIWMSMKQWKNNSNGEKPN
jgi:hypothetical protein